MSNEHQQTAPIQQHTLLFSNEQWLRVQALLDVLDERQALWLSGFLAASQRTHPDPKQNTTENAVRICIAYGSETGNCESLARQLGEQFSRQSIDHDVLSLADFKPRFLARLDYLFVICSTHGDGDPPEPITVFYEGLMSGPAVDLAKVQFAILALGDSSYEHFCTAGKSIDERLGQLGGRRLFSRTDCDVDFEQPAKQWIDRVLESLAQELTAKPPEMLRAEPVPFAQDEMPTRRNPMQVEVLDNIRLSDEKRRKAVHHLELLIEPGSLQLSPGDAVGVLPHNSPELVATVLDLSRFSGDEPVVVNQKAMSLVEVLREHLDITIAGPAFLKCWADASNSQPLRKIIAEESKVQRQYLRNTQVTDILRANPGKVDAQVFVDSLRPLQPRLYDVSNEVTQDTDELHITVKDFRYVMNGRELTGTASHYLLQMQPGESLRIYPHHNKRFRLPEDKDAPLILLGNCTGIAPFRAFLQHLGQMNLQHECWLIFHEVSAEEDFLYQVDLQQAAARGVLKHVDTLFTADQPNVRFEYLFNRHKTRLKNWMGRGAHLYVSGEKDILNQCENQIKSLFEQTGEADVWKQAVSEKRVHRNLY